MSNTKEVKRFIASIADRNYSQANTHLQKMVENKLKEKIKSSLAQKK